MKELKMYMLGSIRAMEENSAWKRAVKAYALELLDNIPDNIERGPDTALRALLLNGAENWHQYSYGGCSLISDCDIAARVCTPSELRRTKNGERSPNRTKTWLDVQARALTQAASKIRAAYNEAKWSIYRAEMGVR